MCLRVYQFSVMIYYRPLSHAYVRLLAYYLHSLLVSLHFMDYLLDR